MKNRIFKVELTEVISFPTEDNQNPPTVRVIDKMFVELSADALSRMEKDPHRLDVVANDQFGVPMLKMVEKIVLPELAI